MLPSAATVGTETNPWSSVPEIGVGLDHVWPKSCVTDEKIVVRTMEPFWASRKSPQVTIALPFPHAAMYSLSRRSPTLLKLPLPCAIRATDHVRPLSPEFATR